MQDANIPMMARIIAISDAFDAMTSLRPYRQKVTAGEAREELKRCAGSQFDPRLVAIFYEMMNEDQFDTTTVKSNQMQIKLATG